MSIMTNAPNSTGDSSDSPEWVGFLSCFIAVVFFGSQLVPVKRFNAGDGIMFNWVQIVAFTIVGAIWHTIIGSPALQPVAMIGGAIWAFGNIVTIPVIQCIGVGMGVMLWSMTNMLTGWATGRFGISGLVDKEPLQNVKYNDIGIVFLIVSCITFVFIKTDTLSEAKLVTEVHECKNTAASNFGVNDFALSREKPDLSFENSPLLHEKGSDNANRSATPQREDGLEVPWTSRLSPAGRRLCGITFSIFFGIMAGSTFTPQKAHADRSKTNEQNVNHYVFSQYLGSLLFQSFVVIIYCIVMKNKPFFNSETLLPGLAGGFMWGVATIAFNNANTILGFSVAFPLVASGPGVVSSLWGILVFKEITGIRNLLIFLAGTMLLIGGSVLVGLSH